MAVLLALFGPKRGVRIELPAETLLGRSSEADLQLVDALISREHCRFRTTGEDVSVEDLGSQNGTFVNGERIAAPRRLQPGDEIAVGESLFVLDGGLDVAAARFGEATLLVTPGAPSPAAEIAAPPAKTTARWDAVAPLVRALQEATEVEAAARAALAALERAFSPERAFVLSGEAGSVRPLVGRGDGAVVSVSRTLLDRAAMLGRAVVVEDAVEDRDLRQARSVARHRLRAVLVAPILREGHAVGFLHADRDSPAFSADEAALAECFAGLCAVAEGFRGRAAPALPPDGPVGGSRAFREALSVAEAAAQAPSTVLVTGETGTGKEEIARFIHRKSARVGGPFVAVNCGAIVESLAESELFGHERGAFTGASATRVGPIEAADGGTLFLDEIGELSPAVQVKLLRVLQERILFRVGGQAPQRVDVRLLCATHRDLEADIRAGRFRQDLFFRIDVIRIHLPPLRDRAEDVEPLARVLLAQVAARLGRRDPGLEAKAIAFLGKQPWPGNAREVGNVLERAIVLRPPGSSGPLGAAEIAAALGGPPSEGKPAVAGATLADKIAALERSEVEAALRRSRGKKSHAAEALGISRPTLDKKIADLGIDIWRDEPAAPLSKE